MRYLRLGVAGVAAGDEDGVDAGQLPEDLAPLLEGELDGLRVGVVLVHGRIPDPDVQAVLVERAATSRPSSRSAGGGSGGCPRRRRSAGGSARRRWCRRRRGRGCTAPTAGGPSRRRSWSSAGSRAGARGSRPRARSRPGTRPGGAPARASSAARGAAGRRRRGRLGRRCRRRGPPAPPLAPGSDSLPASPHRGPPRAAGHSVPAKEPRAAEVPTATTGEPSSGQP